MSKLPNFLAWVKAYASLMSGYLLFEEQSWQAALDKFVAARYASSYCLQSVTPLDAITHSHTLLC